MFTNPSSCNAVAAGNRSGACNYIYSIFSVKNIMLYMEVKYLPMSQRDELRMRLARAIDAQRMTFLYKEMSNKDTGCILLTVTSLFNYFFPDRPLPRDFEERVKKVLPDLETNEIYTIADRINALNLGFEADFQIIPSLQPLPEEDNEQSSVPIQHSPVRMTPSQEIKRKSLPWAVLFTKKGVGGHLMSWTNKEVENPFTENGVNVGSKAEFDLLVKEGFSARLLIHFRKTPEGT